MTESDELTLAEMKKGLIILWLQFIWQYSRNFPDRPVEDAWAWSEQQVQEVLTHLERVTLEDVMAAPDPPHELGYLSLFMQLASLRADDPRRLELAGECLDTLRVEQWMVIRAMARTQSERGVSDHIGAMSEDEMAESVDLIGNVMSLTDEVVAKLLEILEITPEHSAVVRSPSSSYPDTPHPGPAFAGPGFRAQPITERAVTPLRGTRNDRQY